ncbi:hypothetical protein ACFU53_23675 [Streptomyces sp. NPDC057474]|uniref:hypothetical protein n=1 Tax=Streptomyces sp. NPDC057474 TaxID=3346144 RepID=UPI0036B1AA19
MIDLETDDRAFDDRQLSFGEVGPGRAPEPQWVQTVPGSGDGLPMVDELPAGGLPDMEHREPLQVTVVDLAAGPLPRHHRGHHRSR